MQIPSISIEPSFRDICPEVRLGCMLYSVKVRPSGSELLHFIKESLKKKEQQLTIESIHDIVALRATRTAYKATGKDPSRYRPSAEALLRRVVQGKGLYEVNNVVDALNLTSVKSGYSIGGYRADKIEGAVQLGIGKAGEIYEAIGRGELNIEGLPVLRDGKGAFGSPTSDSLRTMVDDGTTLFLAVFFAFEKDASLIQAMEDFGVLLNTFAFAEKIRHWVVV